MWAIKALARGSLPRGHVESYRAKDAGATAKQNGGGERPLRRSQFG